MTDLITPHELQRAMLAKSREVDEALEDYRTRNLAWVEADRASRVARNTALLSTEGTVGERTAKAEQAADGPIYAERMAAALRDSAKEALRARLAQLSALQSLATTVRTEMQMAGRYDG